MSFSFWRTSLRMINSGCSHVAAHGTDSFYVVFRCVYASHLHPFVCRWTCRLFPCLGYGTYCCYEHRAACVFELPFCLDIRPWVGLLVRVVALVLVFWRTCILSSAAAAPEYTATSRGGGFPPLWDTFLMKQLVFTRLWQALGILEREETWALIWDDPIKSGWWKVSWAELHPLTKFNILRCWPPTPQNVAVFGDRLFQEVIKVKWGGFLGGPVVKNPPASAGVVGV